MAKTYYDVDSRLEKIREMYIKMGGKENNLIIPSYGTSIKSLELALKIINYYMSECIAALS